MVQVVLATMLDRYFQVKTMAVSAPSSYFPFKCRLRQLYEPCWNMILSIKRHGVEMSMAN